jgi:tetraacyldisaccharide 4'-kinase
MASLPLPVLCQQLRRYKATLPVCYMTTEAQALYRHASGRAESLAWLRQRRIVAFAGIGNPHAFAATLTHLGSEVAALLVFPDHHPYSADDWRTIVHLATQRQAAGLVTTEKDAVRLAAHWQAPMPVCILQIAVRFMPDAMSLQQQLSL